VKITSVNTRTVTIPLNTVFKTALRTVDTLENVLVTVATDTALTGYGSAAPTAVITGETVASISGAVEHIGNAIAGMELNDHEAVFQKLNRCMIGNNSAKAAVDMALYDLLAQSLQIPLYQLLGGIVHPVATDITISLGDIDTMVADSRRRLAEGFSILKIKVGNDPQLDIERLEQIYQAVGDRATIRIDANQGWSAKQAVYVAAELVHRRVPIELMEQPVTARGWSDMAFVRAHAPMPVYADESVCTARDALELIKIGGVDGINIKLMKCGGIYNAKKIAAVAEAASVPCMIGSMMECSISVTAAAHLAVSTANITGYDLDAPLFCSFNPAAGGVSYNGADIVLPAAPGLGISGIVAG